MKGLQRQREPFIFQLTQTLYAEENGQDEDFSPVSTLVFCLLIALAGAAALLCGYTFGPLSQP